MTEKLRNLRCPNPDVHDTHVWNPYADYPDEPVSEFECLGLTPDDIMHIGRSWTDTPLEDACPCVKAACGLVPRNQVSPECDQHPPTACKTIRQSHRAGDCPGKRWDVVYANPLGEVLKVPEHPCLRAVKKSLIHDEHYHDIPVNGVPIRHLCLGWSNQEEDCNDDTVHPAHAWIPAGRQHPDERSGPMWCKGVSRSELGGSPGEPDLG